MLRLIKYLFYLAILGGLALLAFAYLGPFFGYDFTVPQTVITIPLDLTTE